MAEQHLAGFNLHLFHAAISSGWPDHRFHQSPRKHNSALKFVVSSEIVQVSTLPPQHLARFLKVVKINLQNYLICNLVVITYIGCNKS